MDGSLNFALVISKEPSRAGHSVPDPNT